MSNRFSFLGINKSFSKILFEHQEDKDTRKWLESEKQTDLYSHIKWLMSDNAKNYKIIRFQNDYIGFIRCKELNDKTLEVGVDIFRKFRGLNLGYQSLNFYIHHCCNKYRFFSLWVFEENYAAIKTYKKIGFIEKNGHERYLSRTFSENNFKYLYMTYEKKY